MGKAYLELEFGWDVEDDTIVVTCSGERMINISLGEAMESNPEFVKKHVDECVSTPWLPKWKELFPPTLSKSELIEINEQVRAKTAQLFADLGEESKLEKLREWTNGQVDYYTSASKAGNFEEDTWGKIYHTRMVDKIDELLGESKDATI